MRRPLRLYWWRHPSGRLPNFGDELSRHVVSLVAARPVVHASPERCDMIAIGSVLEHVMASDRPTPIPIWGAGFIRESGPTDPDRVIAHAARGPLSAERLGGSAALGDPALLARFLVERPTKRFAVGLVPHYVEVGLEAVTRFAEHHPSATVISPLQEPRDVIAQIASCDVVLSSSLHGLIVADSLGIPNRWVALSDRVLGDGCKFRDHFGCFGISDVEPLRSPTAEELAAAADGPWDDYRRPGLDDRINDLVAAFPAL